MNNLKMLIIYLINKTKLNNRYKLKKKVKVQPKKSLKNQRKNNKTN